MKLGNNGYATELQKALMGEDVEAQIKAWENFSNEIVAEIRQDVEMYAKNQDKEILVARGYRMLTSAEEKYYNNLVKASKCRNVQQAVTTLEELQSNELMPESIIDRIMEDLVEDHPLLGKIQFQAVKYATKVIMNDHSRQLAAWGEIDAEIQKEITSAFKVLDMVQNKLSAYAVIPLGFLDMDVTFLDAYIRRILTEAIACGLEEAIVKGDGNGKPVGMSKKLAGAVDGVHADKEAIAVTEFSVKEMGALIAGMSKDEKGKARKVGQLTLVVNSATYYGKVAPATKVMNTAGAYVDVLPFAMDIVISEYVDDNKAILVDLDRYFAGIGFESGVQFSDEAQFLADKRVYKVKAYAVGRAIDENSALLLDVSGLEEAFINVKQK